MLDSLRVRTLIASLKVNSGYTVNLKLVAAYQIFKNLFSTTNV